MKYKNAQEILPDKLLKELQKYISGGSIYVPNIESKKQWGEQSGARCYYKQRNEEIRENHKNGKSLDELSFEYGLSIESIRKIVYSTK